MTPDGKTGKSGKLCQILGLGHGIVLLHNNVRLHNARQTQVLLREQFHWVIFEHPPCSSDLAPSELSLFPKMKEHLTGKRFANDEDLKNAIGGHMV